MKNIPLYEVRPIQDLRDMLRQSVKLYADRPMFLIKDSRVLERAGVSKASEALGIAASGGALSATKTGGDSAQPYLPVSYRQFDRDIAAFGTALMKMGEGRRRVAILAETRYEWYVSYLATTNGGHIVVPLDKELPANEIANLLSRSQADVLVYSRLKQEVVEQVRDKLPDLRHRIAMDQPAEGSDDRFFWDDLNAGAKALATGDRSFAEAPIDAEVMSILLFTSGTTARSKAVMLSQRNICVNLMAMCQMTYIDENDTFLSVLPLHHTYECTCGFLCQVYRGSRVAVCEGLRHIVRNLQESQATMILVVPLMLEMFYRRIIKSATSDPKLARKFRLGLKISGALRAIGIDRRRSLFAKVHDNFGGKLRLLIAGGAAIDPAILKGMRDLGLFSIQGYGLTECAPILALNRDVDYNDRAAGLPMPGVEIKIVDKDENGIGEICGRGANVMLGYYQDEEATREAIDEDGFFHTGDLGYLDENQFVIITGRKKNVIVTKNGKNIFPEEIEFLLQRHELVQESLVTGVPGEDGDPVVTAEILPNAEKVEELLGKVALDSEEVRRLIGDVIKQVNHELVTYKYIRDFKLRTIEFEKTTSRKIKRPY